MVKRKEKANEILRKDEIIMDKKEEKLEGQELEDQELEDKTRDLPKDKKEAKENESEETVEDILEERISIKDIIGVDSQPSSKTNVGLGAGIRIINTKKHGKRIVLDLSVIEYLETDEIDIGFTDKSMILAPKGSGICEKPFKLKLYGKKYVIYNTQLVEEITTFFELDFSNTTTNGLKTEKAKLEDGKLVVIAVAI